VKFQYIADDSGSLTRGHLCRLMGVTERGLHAWKHRPPSQRQRRDMVLLAHIRDQHRLSLGSYGRPRMTEELNELGLQVGQRRVGRLMRQNGIQVVRTRKFKVAEGQKMIRGIIFPRTHRQRSYLQHSAESLAAGFHSERAKPEVPSHGLQANHCRVTGSDITYVWTREGWVYLAVIIDLFSRRVVGWAISNRMKQDLALRALNMAIRERGDPKAATRLRSSHGSPLSRFASKPLPGNGIAILRPRLSEASAQARVSSVHEWEG
jgi:transposase InsO family protein